MVTVTASLTPKSDKTPHVVKLKIFWKTTKKWEESDIAEFHKQAPKLADELVRERYWSPDGSIKGNKFTCEDFAIRIICQFACTKGLPIKLKTGVRTYRNMEIYNAAEHDRHASNIYGFSEMVMLTYGAPDMQRVGVNTIAPPDILAGDILAKALDHGGVAHHIQVIITKTQNQIHIFQGNSGAANKLSFFYRIVGKNPADHKDSSYTGMNIERGVYTRIEGSSWQYTNNSTGRVYDNELRKYLLYRWNFLGFNT